MDGLECRPLWCSRGIPPHMQRCTRSVDGTHTRKAKAITWPSLSYMCHADCEGQVEGHPLFLLSLDTEKGEHTPSVYVGSVWGVCGKRVGSVWEFRPV